jgi:hypothetical protein
MKSDPLMPKEARSGTVAVVVKIVLDKDMISTPAFKFVDRLFVNG